MCQLVLISIDKHTDKNSIFEYLLITDMTDIFNVFILYLLN